MSGLNLKRKPDKTSPGQTRLPEDSRDAVNEEIQAVATEFISANCYNPQFAMLPSSFARWQVSASLDADSVVEVSLEIKL